MRLYQDQPSGTVTALRALRRDATDAEKALRRALREAFPRLKWRFQTPVGPYRADFLCFAARLVIEVDGALHSEVASYDARRTRFIKEQGYTVLRFWNNDVLGNIEGVIDAIALSLREREGTRRVSGGKGEGDQADKNKRLVPRSPSPSHASRGPLPLPTGEGR